MPPVGSKAFVFELTADGVPKAHLLSPYPSRNAINRLITLNGPVGRMFNRNATAAGAVHILGYETRGDTSMANVLPLDSIESGKLIAERMNAAR